MSQTVYGPLPIEISGPARVYGFDIDNTGATFARVRLMRGEGTLLVDCMVPPYHGHGHMPACDEPLLPHHSLTWLWGTGPECIYVLDGAVVRLEAVEPLVPNLIGYINYSTEE